MAASFLEGVGVGQTNNSCTQNEKLIISIVINFVDNDKNINTNISLLKKLEKRI